MPRTSSARNVPPWIRFRFLAGGGFVCGNTRSGITSYAYPTSTHATRAHKEPTKVAMRMLAGESVSLREAFQSCREYDAANWKLLNQDPAP